MSEQPEKLKLDFLLNREESDQSRRDPNGKRPKAPTSRGSSSTSPTPESAVRQSRDSYVRERSTPSFQRRSAADPSGSQNPPTSQGSSSRTTPRAPPQRGKIFHCDLCTKTFVERGNLNKHKSSVHRKEKNKVCPEPGCGKSFSFRDGLVRHIAHVHQNQRRYSCQLCEKSFKQASHLAKHMRSIHKQEP